MKTPLEKAKYELVSLYLENRTEYINENNMEDAKQTEQDIKEIKKITSAKKLVEWLRNQGFEQRFAIELLMKSGFKRLPDNVYEGFWDT